MQLVKLTLTWLSLIVCATGIFQLAWAVYLEVFVDGWQLFNNVWDPRVMPYVIFSIAIMIIAWVIASFAAMIPNRGYFVP